MINLEHPRTQAFRLPKHILFLFILLTDPNQLSPQDNKQYEEFLMYLEDMLPRVCKSRIVYLILTSVIDRELKKVRLALDLRIVAAFFIPVGEMSNAEFATRLDGLRSSRSSSDSVLCSPNREGMGDNAKNSDGN